MSNDRTELNDLAVSEPSRLNAMIQTWTDMTKNVLHAPEQASSPATTSTLPHRHPEWTNFDADTPDEYVRKKQPRRKRASQDTRRLPPKTGIRARKNTNLKIVGKELQLQFTGDDPGIAMDLRTTALVPGPYRLKFRLLAGSRSTGEVFYTTEPTVTLPKGERVEFDIPADGEWQDILIEVPTDKRLQQLRLDVSEGPGKATITDLSLLDADGNTISSWPANE